MNTEAVNRTRRRAGIWAASIAVGALAAGLITVNVATRGEPAEAETPAAAQVVHQPTALQSEALAWAQSLGDFDAATHRGSGDAVIQLPEGAGAGILVARHNGDGAFAVTMLGADGLPTGEQPVNRSGAYHGTTAWGLRNAPEASAVQITADGDWSLIVAPLSAALPMPNESNGTGDAVFIYDGTPAAMTAERSGDSYFGVTVFAENHDAATRSLTQTGPFTGEARFVPTLPAIVTVQATGDWSLNLH